MAQGNGARVRRSSAAWQQLVGAQLHSGLSQAAFCRREGVALSTFQYWKRRFATNDEGSASGDGPAVIDLGALEDRPTGWEVEIALGDGVSLTLRRR